MGEVPIYHEKTHDKLKIPEYNFEDGLQRAIEIISSVLEQKDVVVDGYWSNRVSVNPLEFSNARKNLKSRIFGMRKNYK
jgi:hypothetical protein